MTLLKVAMSALTALLFHHPCFSSLAHVWGVLCCAVLCCAVLCCVVVLCMCACLCVSLCHVSGVEQLCQARRMIGGIGNMLFSTYSQMGKIQGFLGEPLMPCVHSKRHRVCRHHAHMCFECAHGNVFEWTQVVHGRGVVVSLVFLTSKTSVFFFTFLGHLNRMLWSSLVANFLLTMEGSRRVIT